MNLIHKVGKFYQKVIMKNMGFFIFSGLMMVIFGQGGWFPNQEISQIADLVYSMVLPVMIAYECGVKLSDSYGGVLAVIAMTGILVGNAGVGFLGAMVVGPLVGTIWNHSEAYFEQKTDFRLKMLMKNLSVAAVGGCISLLAYFFFVPVLKIGMKFIEIGISSLIDSHLMFALSLIIEPAKVFFLNNLVNHAILIPLGIEQLQSMGRSVLFLAEANPGPGFGILMALFLLRSSEKNELASAMVAQGLGGIHEVYFPYVLSNFRLLIPLILGGMAGNAWFHFMDAGVQGPVTPGSILIVLLMAGKSKLFAVLFGVLISAIVSFCGALFFLAAEGKYFTERHRESDLQKKDEVKESRKEKIERIAVVCDGGVGSSVMGAALLRRALAAKQQKGVIVEAYAADLVPDEIKVLLCQKDYYEYLPEYIREREIFIVENLVRTDAYAAVLEEIQKRNRE